MNDQALLEDVRRYLAALQRRRGLVATCVGVSLLAATLYNYTAREVYQATTQVLIERETPNVLPSKEVVDLGQAAADYYQTQYELLAGRVLAARAVERLSLQTHPEFAGGASVPIWERLRRTVSGEPANGVDADGQPLAPPVAAFRARLRVEPVIGSRLVNLRFSAQDPALAAQAANTFAQVYIEQALEFRFTTSSEATGWLSARLKEQQAKVEEAERKLQAYREREGLVNIEERQSLADQRLASFAAAATTAHTERIAKETLYKRIRSLAPEELQAYPTVLASPVVQRFKARLAELQAESVRLAETLGDKHPEMVRVRSEIQATEAKLAAEIAVVLRAVESDYQTALQQETSLQANLDAAKREALEINRKAIDHNVLEREVESNQQLFQNLMNRTKESGLETELKATNIRVVEKAEVPRAPISPSRGRNLLLAALAGLVIGVGLTLVFEHFDNTVKTPEDVKLRLGLPFLGMVPDVEAPAGTDGKTPLVLRDPRSTAAEAYRVLRTNLVFSSADASGRALLVSSANPGEGKTTTVANLAACLAQNGSRVLLVDADLRRPRLHELFGVDSTPGLSDLIVGTCEQADAIQPSGVKGLRLLPCGYVPPNPAELLGSPRMRDLIRTLRGLYDWVLLDTPPLLAMADAPVLCPLADGVVLVVSAEKTGRPALERALDQVRSVRGRVTGVVLNRVDLERNSYYYGQYYGEYYRGYYSEPQEAVGGPRRLRRP